MIIVGIRIHALLTKRKRYKDTYFKNIHRADNCTLCNVIVCKPHKKYKFLNKKEIEVGIPLIEKVFLFDFHKELFFVILCSCHRQAPFLYTSSQGHVIETAI